MLVVAYGSLWLSTRGQHPEAARLLVQTEREARRQFTLSPPWITFVVPRALVW